MDSNITPSYKKCTKCRQLKPVHAFGKHVHCKQCKREAMAQWRQDNPEENKRRIQAHRAKYPNASFASHLKCKYSLSLKEYEKMLQAQNGACAICEKPETVRQKSKIKRLSVDHCHITGRVRGLLCVRCNVAIGLLKENEDIFKKALDYKKKYG